MRRALAAVVLVAAAAAAGAVAYGAWANEREFERFIVAGDRALASDQPFQALEAYSGAIARRPDSMVARLKRGAVYFAQGEFQSALRDLREAVDLDPASPQAQELLGDAHAATGRHDRAVDDYQASLALDESRPRVFYKLGLAHYRAGQAADAVAPLEQAIALEPSIPHGHYMLGLAFRDSRHLDEARAALEQAVTSDAGDIAAREALAEVYGQAGQTTKSIDQLEALAALDTSRPERLVALGLAQASAGRPETAVLTLGRAADRFPDSPVVYAALGHVWLTTARARNDRVALRKAVEALQVAAGRSDASSDSLTELGRALLLSGDVDGAERALRQAVSRPPAPPDAYAQLAATAERGGRIQDARDALVKYATLVGDAQPLGDTAARIGGFSMRLGEPAVALRWFDRALDDGGPAPALLARLAEAAWQAGDLARARQAVDDGLAIAPSDRALQQLKRRLPPA